MHVNEGFKNTYQRIKAWSRPKITRVEGFEWKKNVWEERKEILLRERSEEWDLIRAQPLNRNRSSMDRSICRDLLSTKSRQKWICWDAVEDLSTVKTPRWIKNLSRIYWPNRRFRKLAWWIEEVVENQSRRNPEIPMDRNSIKICREKDKERLDRREFVEGLSRSYRAWRKKVFQRREKHIEMNATSKLLKQGSKQHVKLSRLLSTNMQSIQKSKTHIHTLNKFNQFYISKIS